MMTSFSTYNWLKHRLEKREQVPTQPHFQALHFTTRSEHTPSYDDRDPPYGTSHSVSHVDIYIFTKRDEFELFVSEIARSGEKFVFYEVKALGKATVNVQINVETEDK